MKFRVQLFVLCCESCKEVLIVTTEVAYAASTSGFAASIHRHTCTSPEGARLKKGTTTIEIDTSSLR